MTDLAGDQAVEDLAKRIEEDRFVLIGHLFEHCPRGIRNNVQYHLMQLGLDADFVSGLTKEGVVALKKRRRESSSS